MTRKQLRFVRLPRHPGFAVSTWIVLLMASGVASTAIAQAEFTGTTLQPGFETQGQNISITATEPKVLVAPEVISITRTCGSAINITSEQRNTLARIKGTVESSSCPAASRGEYTFVIAIRDENNERSTLEFTETWQRSDDAPINFMKEYPIGENVDLTRVSLRGLRCSCDDLPDGPAE